MKINRLVPFLIAGVIFVVIGIVVATTVKVFPVQGSARSTSIDSLFYFMLAIAVVIFLIVEGGLIYSIIRFRAKKDDMSDGAPEHGNTALEITWTAIPAVIVFVLSILSFQVFADTRKATEGELPITVVGQQFQWSFQYELPAGADKTDGMTTEKLDKVKNYMISDKLYLPVNRAARMDIHAQDVMHGFFIPEFRIKQDAIPGRVTNAYFTPITTGEYWVICSNLCGVGHAAMSQINRVEVVTQAEYDKFVGDLFTKAIAIVNDPRNPEVGKQLIVQKYPCGTCHVLDDAGIKGNVGPNLNGIATRAANHLASNEGIMASAGTDAAAYIRTSIINPNYYIVSGYNAGIMPQVYGDRTVMPEDDLEAIVAYLMTQTAKP